MKYKNGFTIIEITVTVAIIAILATFVGMSLTGQQVKARDSVRSTKVNIIADALERYYDKHGEYPSVRALLNTYSDNTGTAVASLLSLNEQATLVMPGAGSGTTNSIASSITTNDTIAYVASSAVGNDNCQSSAQGGCDQYTLSYKKESDGSTVTIDSLKKGRATDPNTPLQAPAKPILAAVQSGTNLVTTSSTPTCSTSASTTPRYAFRVQVGAGAWSAWSSWQTTNTYTRSGNTNATSYSFQVHVRCESSTFLSDTSADSDVATITYYIPPAIPTTPMITAALSGSNVVGTSSIVTCDIGSGQYRIDRRINDGAWTIGSWGGGNTYSIAAVDGTKYGFNTTVRCVNGTQISTSTTNGTATYIDPVADPATPVINASISGSSAVGTINAITCPAETTTKYTIRYLARATTTSGAWTDWPAWTTSPSLSVAANQGWQYNFQGAVACFGAFANSNAIFSSVAATVMPISTPALPVWNSDYTYFYSSTGSWKQTVKYTTSCPTGSWVTLKTFDSYPEWDTSKHYAHSWPYEDWWNTGSTSTKYVKYYAQYRCSTDYTSATSNNAYNRIPVKP